MKVRVCEDEPDLGFLVKTALTRKGLEVVVHSSDFESLMDVKKWDGFDVVVMDVLVRELVTGVDILRWMKEHVPHVRRIAWSAVHESFPEMGELCEAIIPKGGYHDLLLAVLGDDGDY